jgi:hypothetical protein
MATQKFTFHVLTAGQGSVEERDAYYTDEDAAIDDRDDHARDGEEVIEITDAKGATVWKNRRY